MIKPLRKRKHGREWHKVPQRWSCKTNRHKWFNVNNLWEIGTSSLLKTSVSMMYCYRPPTKLREGNIFSCVCLSVQGGPMWPSPMKHGYSPPPPQLTSGGYGLKRTVRILLECFRVDHIFVLADLLKSKEDRCKSNIWSPLVTSLSWLRILS